MKYQKFIFTNYFFSPKTGELQLNYSFDKKLFFTEQFFFPKQKKYIPLQSKSLEQAFFLLWITAGMSYWKFFAPKKIIIENKTISSQQAQFFHTLYKNGLGEFFYKNNIDFRGLVNFPSEKSVDRDKYKSKPFQKKVVSSQKKVLVPFGGGKDSAVSVALLQDLKIPFGMFMLRHFPAVERFAKKIDGDYLVVDRRLSQNFFEFSEKKALYHGHVPFTSITSAVAVVVAILYGFSDIILSDEKSASEENITYLGMKVNHQWSKSLEFEELFSQYVTKYVDSSIRYFSLLRGFSELKIAQIFSKHEEFFSYFQSCNMSFRFGKEAKMPEWCNKCPKCLFTFIMLGAWISKKELIGIFQKNLYNDASLLPLFLELLGISGHKPFECVGTTKEVSMALYMTSQKNEFSDDVLMQYFQKNIFSKIKNPKKTIQALLKISRRTRIPKDYPDILQ